MYSHVAPGQELPPGLQNPLDAALAARDRDILSMVAEALERRRACLAFQPIVQSRRQGRPAFWEGLIRIRDPSGRLIPAADFIGAVEAHELGREIDTLSLELGLAALRQAPGLRLAVNMSARSIGYAPWIAAMERGLAADPTAAERLVLEITESSAMLMPDIVRVFMGNLQLRGVSFALDDFGAGFTSFRYLRDFDFDILKIDGAFIRGIAGNPDNQVLVKSLIGLARHFEMFTVAEFVESHEDAEWLAEHGIDCQQGYFFGTPTQTPWWLAGEAGNRRAG